MFNSSAILADAVHDTGDAVAIGLSTLFEKISNKKDDESYTLGYKRYSLLGAVLTSIILIVGSILVLFENVPKLFAPEKVNYDGMLILGIVAITINLVASRVVHQGHTHNESILSLHFLEDILGWIAIILVSLILRFTDWYFLDPLLSLLTFLFILNQALPKFWENVKIFLNHAPEDLTVEKLKTELELIEDIAFIPQLNIWTTDGIEKCAMIYICLKNPQKIQETKQAVHQLLKAYDISRVTIECDESLAEHKAHGNMEN